MGKKVLTIFIAAFVSVSGFYTAVHAAKEVPGTVPVLPPLQPPPAGFKVDSTQFFNGSPLELQENLPVSQSDQAAPPSQAVAALPPLSHNKRAWPYAVLAIVILGGFIVYRYVRRPKN
jgi:hypothetical protein